MTLPLLTSHFSSRQASRVLLTVLVLRSRDSTRTILLAAVYSLEVADIKAVVCYRHKLCATQEASILRITELISRRKKKKKLIHQRVGNLWQLHSVLNVKIPNQKPKKESRVKLHFLTVTVTSEAHFEQELPKEKLKGACTFGTAQTPSEKRVRSRVIPKGLKKRCRKRNPEISYGTESIVDFLRWPKSRENHSP